MPAREPFLEQLATYAAFDPVEESMRDRMHAFVAEYDNCFERALQVGHITASCWVVDPERGQALLAWHAKLDRWLQMGGHVEDDPTLLESAMRELREESGLASFHPLQEAIFDLDIHAIPARKQEPEHFHYDVRYLFEADPAETLVVSPESRALAWVPLDGVGERNPEESMLRMVAKTRRMLSD